MTIFETGSFEVEVEPEHWWIPKKSGASVVSKYNDESQTLILLAFQAEGYVDGKEHTVLLALSETMICGIVTQLAAAMAEADVPASLQQSMYAEAAGALEARKRVN